MNNNDIPQSFENDEVPKQEQHVSESTDFLMQTIESNARENFIYKTSRDKVDPDEQELRFQEFTVRGEYDAFMSKVQAYKDKVDPESDVIKDVAFLQDMIQRLFETYYSKSKSLASIFQSAEEKEKFSTLARTYLIEGFDEALATAEKNHPKSFLSPEERDALLY